MIHTIRNKAPRIADSAFIAWNAEVAGEALVGEDSSVWYGATLRADLAPVRVGERTSIQDGAVLHVNFDMPCTVGDDCTIGHGAVIHGCSVGNACLIGIGAIILNGASIADECIVGAGALVTEGKSFPPRSLIIGSPARLARTVTDEEVAKIRKNAATYVGLAREAKSEREMAPAGLPPP
jgi:carbonic anhydrase/acetyltransferase-like protein (isoleucine patch superfamily)